jgi:lysophospholipase L1-like esterase
VGVETDTHKMKVGDGTTAWTALAYAGPTAEPPITVGSTSQYWRGDKTFQTLDKTAVGLGNNDNTSDVNKPVSTAQAAAIAAKLNTSAVVENSDGTVTVGSVTGLEPLPIASAVVTANTAPAIGKTTYYNAMGGNLAVPLLALSGLNDKARFSVRRDPLDISNNTITFTCAGSDAFYSSLATTFTLPIMGEQRDFQVATVGATKYWAPAGPINPVAGNDLRYAAIALTPKPKVQVTDNCNASLSILTAISTPSTDRLPYVVGVSACDLQLTFANYFVQIGSPFVEIDPATSVTFSAAIEDAAGNVYAAMFEGGLRTITLPGGASITSKPIAIDVTKGDLIYIRVYLSAGSFYANHKVINTTNGGGSVNSSDLTATGAGATGLSGGVIKQSWGPVAITGTPTGPGIPKSVVVMGDSIAQGAEDGSHLSQAGYASAKPWWSGGGPFRRALSGGNAGVVTVAIGSDLQTQFLTNNYHFHRAQVIQFARYCVNEYGHNDLGSRTVAQLQADLLTQGKRNLARGIVKNFLTTLLVQTSSTDRWRTTTNQTHTTWESNRVTHNNWVRAGGPIDPVTFAAVAVGTSGALLFGQLGHPYAGFLEVTDTVETARDSGYWKPPQRTVTDAAATAASSTVTSATASFTSADVGLGIILVGAGAAGADYIGQIDTVTNSTTVTVVATVGNPATTVSAALLLIGTYTSGGVHPTTSGNAAIAAAIQAPLLALLS